MKKRIGVVVALIAVVLVAVIAFAFAKGGPDICEGVNRELGGCSADQPRFSAEDCEGIASEIGEQIDRRGLEIAQEGASEDMSLAGRLSNDRTLVFVRASQWMQSNSFQCAERQEMLNGAMEQLSVEYVDVAVEHLYDEGDWDRGDLLQEMTENIELLRWWEG